jgi:hypothetical protein
MARKTEMLSVIVDGTVVSFTLKRLTIKQEDAYRTWVQKKITDESREMLKSYSTAIQIDALAKICVALTAGPCAMTGTEGGARLGTPEGMAKFIQLAASEDHPDMTEDAAREIVMDNLEECGRVVKLLHPMAKLILEQETGPK